MKANYCYGIATMLLLNGCGPVRDAVSTPLRARYEAFRLGEAPLEASNRFSADPRAAALGHRLFFEPRLSGPLGGSNGAAIPGSLGEPGDVGRVACVSCHDLERGGADTRSRPAATSQGAGWTGRNSPSVLNVAWLGPFMFWDGRADSIWGQAAAALEAGATHNFTRVEVARVIYEHHRAEYEAIFGPMPADLIDTSSTARLPARGKPGVAAYDAMAEADKAAVTTVLVNVGKALGAFQRTLVCADSPFDRWLDGDDEALSPEALRGAEFFVGDASCADCHRGPTFSDRQFHNVGFPQVGLHTPNTDVGREDGVGRVEGFEFRRGSIHSDAAPAGGPLDEVVGAPIRGGFRTPGLRCVAQTAPYGHSGALPSLWDVVEHYNWGVRGVGATGEMEAAIQPLELSDGELADLVAFLEALTGAPLPEEVTKAP